jgi:hypothetical protein
MNPQAIHYLVTLDGASPWTRATGQRAPWPGHRAALTRRATRRRRIR